MVAVSGPGWRLAPCLVALVEQADEGWPDRSRASDGSIGDAAHAARTSDHNPDASGDVLAVDLTNDPDAGPDLDALWAHLIARRDPRVKYVIWEGRIVKSYVDGAGRPKWVPQPYTGADPHTNHIHVSVLDTEAAKADVSPWFPEEDDLPTIAELNAAAKAGQLDAFFERAGAILTNRTKLATQAQVSIVANLIRDDPDLDPAEVARLVLAGLDPAAIAAAIPTELADQVADELAQRLAG